MIERLQRIATFLKHLTPLILIIAAISFAVALLSLLETPWLQGDDLLIPAILALVWSATLYSVSKLFAGVPAKAKVGARFRERLSARLRRAVLWVLGLAMLLLTLSVVILSYQLLRAWL